MIPPMLGRKATGSVDAATAVTGLSQGRMREASSLTVEIQVYLSPSVLLCPFPKVKTNSKRGGGRKAQ